MRHRRHLWIVVGLTALLIAPAAFGQMQIKVNDNTWMKFGLLLQTQADAQEDPVSGSYAQNVFIRRVRLLLGGQITPNVTFFVETDSPNLGKSLTTGTKNVQPSIYLQDAYVEYKFSEKLAFDAGLMLVSPSRNGLQSAASLLPVDYGAYTFAESAPTQSSAGRDTGIQAKGYLAKGKLEYRAGVFQGMRDQQNRELRFTGRVQYNFFDKENSFFYTGTYLGKKKVLALGAGVDRQHKYIGYAFDAFLDYPLKNGAVTAQFDHIRYDGDTFLKSLADQHDTLLEAGYLIGKTRIQPVVQVARRNFAAASGNDENRYGAGVNYFLSGHTANIKALYTQIDSRLTDSSRQFTIQFQFFYY